MTKDELSKEDLDAVNKEIEKATQALSESALARAREEGKQEAAKEIELKRQLEEQEKKTKDLEAKLADTQKVAEGNIKQLQEKVDGMISSKQVIASQNPLGADPNKHPVDSWSKEQVDSFEEKCARAFFGPSFDDRV